MSLALSQRPDGTWNGAMLTIPGARAQDFEGVGTIPAVRRMLEYGWDRESPPLVRARRTLFRLLAEDDDAGLMFELGPKGGATDVDTVRHARAMLREAAAATLAQAGYEADPRLRGAARRIVERFDSYLRSPLAEKPFVRAGNQHVLAPEAAPPSIYALVMLAHMPRFCSENYDIMDHVYASLSQPAPRALPARVVGKRVMSEPHLVLGDPLPHRSAVEADFAGALFWLETLARLGLLRRNENWSRIFDHLLDERDASGVWRIDRRLSSARSSIPFAWASFPLEPHPAPDALAAEGTFRLGVIARWSGRAIELA
ncbi:MAG TPA: hypothetical protein VGR59_12350 [Gemmatimonadaceae bacterium]|nr:hypothetical protein [Gemmatimonadaceae bacterium]